MKIQILFALVVVFVSVGHSDASPFNLFQQGRDLIFGKKPELPEGYFGTSIYNAIKNNIPESTRFTKHTLMAVCKWFIAIEDDLRNVANISLVKVPSHLQDQASKGIQALAGAGADFIELMGQIAQRLTSITRIGEIPSLIIGHFGKQLQSVFTALYSSIRTLYSAGLNIQTDILPESFKAFWRIPGAMWSDLTSLPMNMAKFTINFFAPGPLKGYIRYENNNNNNMIEVN